MRVKVPFHFESFQNGRKMKLYVYRTWTEFETIGLNGDTRRDVIRIDAPVHEHGNGYACDGKCGVKS